MSRISSNNLKLSKPRVPQGFLLSPIKDQKLIETKRRQIVEGASRLFFEKGFHLASIREIASACNMSMGQLYHYISSKDDILILIFNQLMELWYKELLDPAIHEIKEPLPRLVKVLERVVRFISENRKLILLVITESRSLNKKYLRIVQDMDNKNFINVYCNLLQDVAKEHPFEMDLDMAANFIAFSSMFYVLRGWSVREKNPDKRAEFIVKSILRGLGLPFLKNA